MPRYSRIIHIFTMAATILWSIGLPLGALVPAPAQAAVASEQIIFGNPVHLKGSVANTSVFGLNLAVSASETLSSVRVTLGARGGEFAAVDLAAMGTGAGSGLGLWVDDDGSSSIGTLNTSQDHAVTLAGSGPTLVASRLAKLTPTATAAVTDSSMSLAVGDVVLASTSTGCSVYPCYAWHMVTTGATGVSSSSLRLDASSTAPTYPGGTQFSKFTPAATGSYTINGTANITSPALAVGDIVYYLNTGSGSGAWGVVTTALTATAFQVNGTNLTSGTYRISKLAVSSTQFVVSGSASITPATVGNAGGNYTSPAVGDIVFATSLGWGVVTDGTLTSGTFAINGRAVAAGSYVISKVTGYSPATAEVTDTSLSIATGDVSLSYPAMDPTSASYQWHMVTTGTTGVAGTALRMDNAPNAPMWAWVATLTPASGAVIPANDTGNNLGADFFVTVSTPSSGLVSGHKFSLGIASSGDVTLSAGSSTMNSPGGAGFVEIDTAAPTIQTVNGFASSTTLNVNFSEPVQKAAGGNLAAGDFTFVDNGTVAGHTISSVSHVAGQSFATVTLSGNLDSGDFDVSPSTLAAASSAIVDMAGNVMGTLAVSLTSSLTITNTSLPAATVGTSYSTTLTAAGGTGTLNASNPWSVLSGSLPAGLTLNQTTGVISGTPTTAGTPNFTIKVRDNAGTPNEATMFFTMSVASSSGGIPAVTGVSPAALAVNSSAVTLTITGSNTHFGATSTVSLSGTGITVGSVVGTTTATQIAVSVSIAGNASTGGRDVTVATTSPAETVTMTNGFTVLSGSSSGLTLQAPANASTGVPLPPNFNFSP
ncbi:MAG: putative Ig domain-containing protein, partial [Candidatus Kerfeldbacteria bacterium]|nr:putative Ig domain-containing protein [Candidatus Kerfeldbacteria bacterium]